MEASFWHDKWEINQIGFHESETNPLLVKHINKLNLPAHARIFLPLCGKTLDIAYLLEHGYRVTGIELSEIAIDALFAGLDLIPTITTSGALKRYHAHNIEIFLGDFFDLNSKVLSKQGNIDAIYDRAALIALPPETRKHYSKHLIKITDTAPQLIICLEYDQAIMDGPPFSLIPAEVHRHYDASYVVDRVEKNEMPNGLKGKFPTVESTWLLHPS